MSDTRTEVLKPSHKFWRGFMARLNDGLIKHGCNHQTYDVIEPILRTLSGISIPETIGYFESKGVLCNCEVFFKTDWRKKSTPAVVEIDRDTEKNMGLKKSGY
jgi:hypothetical protein